MRSPRTYLELERTTRQGISIRPQPDVKEVPTGAPNRKAYTMPFGLWLRTTRKKAAKTKAYPVRIRL